MLSPKSACVTNQQKTYQVLDIMSPQKERLKKRKLSFSPKNWMFKFKNMPHTRYWVQEKLWIKESMAANADKEELCLVTDSLPKPKTWQSKDSLLVIELSHQQEILSEKQSGMEMALIKESSRSKKMLVLNPRMIKKRNNSLVECLYHKSRSITEKRKPRKYPKAWKYKFKPQLFDSKDRKSISFYSHAKVGLERKRRRFWSLRLQKQSHMFHDDAHVTISLNETVIVQPSCASQLGPHRIKRLQSKRKKRRFFKSWRFKLKNRTKSSMEIELAPIQVKQQLLQAQQYTWNNDDQRSKTKAF